MSDELAIPGDKTFWTHHSGRVYRVIAVANVHSDDQERYPITVVYRGVTKKRVWSKSLVRFHATMTQGVRIATPPENKWLLE